MKYIWNYPRYKQDPKRQSENPLSGSTPNPVPSILTLVLGPMGTPVSALSPTFPPTPTHRSPGSFRPTLPSASANVALTPAPSPLSRFALARKCGNKMWFLEIRFLILNY